MSKLEEIMEAIYNNGLEFEVYDKLHDLIINRYKKITLENVCRKQSMALAIKLNKGKNKEIDIALDEENLYD